MMKHQTQASQAICDFLEWMGLSPRRIDMPACTDAFRQQMQAGLRGEKSPLLMLPSWLSGIPEIPTGGQAIALDAGGTNLRTALVRFAETGPQILWQQTQTMPGRNGKITGQDFFQTLAHCVEPLLDQTDRIGFCFSFPAEIQPDLDAKVLHFNKEIQIEGCDGILLAQEFQNHLSRPVQISVLNDTTATLLGGAALGGCYDGLIGFILGTGTNTCYPESGENLTKYPGISTDSMLINTEAAGFDGFERGACDVELDRASAIPGDQPYGKAVSGGYLGQLIGLVLRRAAEEGLLSGDFSALGPFDMSAVDSFLREPQGDNLIAEACRVPEDRSGAEQICRGCIDRAARLVTVNLAAVMLQGNFGRTAPARIVAEGSTFWKCRDYQEAIRREMERFTANELGLKWEFCQVPNANLIGAGAAAFRI